MKNKLNIKYLKIRFYRNYIYSIIYYKDKLYNSSQLCCVGHIDKLLMSDYVSNSGHIINIFKDTDKRFYFFVFFGVLGSNSETFGLLHL